MKEDLSFPTLLAGPILRRAEPERVCIWIASSKPVSMRAEIFRVDDLKKATDAYESKINAKAIGLGSAESLRLGERLYIGLVTACPIQEEEDVDDDDDDDDDVVNNDSHTSKVGFPTDDLLAYDLEISCKDGYVKKSETLKDLGLLSGNNAIIYGDQFGAGDDDNNKNNDILLPTFFLRGPNTPLNVLHGSCRKLHGKGEDCLAIADKLIKDSAKDINRRPSALFLTGDQIYADDVAGPLIRYLNQFGVNLLGWEEGINGIHQKLSEIDIGERQRIVTEHAKFTSDNASNHLLSFGEFAAMYLIGWNIENWPNSYPDIRTIPHRKQKRYRMEIKQLERARKAMPAVRRVLANIPTYMIFDDHEITDDWNITMEWHEGVKASDCGKQVVANGFAAFWAFQGWGNDPNLYSDEFIQHIVKYLEKNGSINFSERKAFEDYLWDFHGWTFNAPTSPPTIFLDCRTQRQYDSVNGPPILLDDEGLHALSRAALQADYEKEDQLIIVSPTPVFGFELAEELQEYLASKSTVYKWDLETWASNEKGFIRFLTFLNQNMASRHCIFLSGDVHYGFTMRASFKLLQKRNGKENLATSITQLTSSALKTTSLSKEVIINEVLGRLSQLFSSRRSMRIGWNDMPSKSQKLKHQKKNGIMYADEHRVKPNSDAIERKPPDWIESRYIVKASGFSIPSLVITDNNIGLVTIDKHRSKIFHKLLVQKKNKIKIHEAVLK
jgi:hypothetical protein